PQQIAGVYRLLQPGVRQAVQVDLHRTPAADLTGWSNGQPRPARTNCGSRGCPFPPPGSSVLALGMATAVLQQLQRTLALATAPCLDLAAQIATLTSRFLCGPITPAATLDFEKDLRRSLDECGRLVLQSVFNHIEPDDPQDAPKHTQ